MYKTKTVNPADLKKIAIQKQQKIREITGEELDPHKAWTIIKNESQDFTNSDQKAIEADALLAELMQVNGLRIADEANGEGKETPTLSDQEKIRIREKERARARARADGME